MKKVAVFLAILFCATAWAGKEGDLSNTYGEPTSLASMADWYTVKAVNISGLTNLTTLTSYPGLVLKMFGNKSQSTNAFVKCVTTQNDTIIVPVMAGSSTGKLPPIAFVFKTGTSDSLLFYFQKR